MLKIYFHVITHWSILVYKIPQFWAKAANPKSHDTFLERRHPEVTKNPNYVLSPRGSQRSSSWTINITPYFL